MLAISRRMRTFSRKSATVRTNRMTSPLLPRSSLRLYKGKFEAVASIFAEAWRGVVGYGRCVAPKKLRWPDLMRGNCRLEGTAGFDSGVIEDRLNRAHSAYKR